MRWLVRERDRLISRLYVHLDASLVDDLDWLSVLAAFSVHWRPYDLAPAEVFKLLHYSLPASLSRLDQYCIVSWTHLILHPSTVLANLTYLTDTFLLQDALQALMTRAELLGELIALARPELSSHHIDLLQFVCLIWVRTVWVSRNALELCHLSLAFELVLVVSEGCVLLTYRPLDHRLVSRSWDEIGLRPIRLLENCLVFNLFFKLHLAFNSHIPH